MSKTTTDRFAQKDSFYYCYTKPRSFFNRLFAWKNFWSPYCENCHKWVPSYAPMLGIPAAEKVFFELQESDIVKSLVDQDWSVLNGTEWLRNWTTQPAIFISLGRCDTCDGPFGVLGEVHGQAADGTLYLGQVFLIEIERTSGLVLLETAINRSLIANDAMYAKAVDLCKALGSSMDFAKIALAQQQREKANDLGRRGMTDQRKGKLDRAEENLNNALQIFEELDERESQAITYMNLGTVYYDRRLLGHAETLLKKSLVLFEQINSRTNLGTVYGLLGTIHFDSEEFDQAERFFRQALEIDTALSNKRGMAMGYHSLGDVCRTRDERQQARDTYAEALKIWVELGDKTQAKLIEVELHRLDR